MFANYLKIAWRQTVKHPAFSFINVFGLASSMAICLFLILLLEDAHSYDKFHKEGDRIYRINTEAIRTDGRREDYASSPYVIGDALARECPYIESWAMCNSTIGSEFVVGNDRFRGRTYFTNKSFLEVFNFPLKQGNKDLALELPGSIVLSAELAKKFYSDGDAVGKTIQLESLGDFIITGILADPLGKTHLDFDALASIASVPALEKNNQVQSTLSNWLNYYSNFNYIKLKPGTSVQSIEAALARITASNFKGKKLESRDAGYRFYLQSLNKITPGPILSNSEGKGLPSMLLWVLGVLAGIIMMSSVFNYTSLTIARSSYRLKEIAMRKVAGSKERVIVYQAVIESVFTAILALILAFIMLHVLLPWFQSTSFVQDAEIILQVTPRSIFYFILFAGTIGILGGVLPGAVLSKIKPVSLFNNLQNTKFFGKMGFRNALLCFQIILCLIFVNVIYVVNKQMKYSTSVNFGFQHAPVYNIDLQGQPYALVKESLERISGIEIVSGISHLMGNYSDWKDDVRSLPDKEPMGVREYFIDENYLRNFDILLLAGKDFEKKSAPVREHAIIVNESFLKKFNLGSPGEAIGKDITIGDSVLVSIGGVVKDFLFKPAEYVVEAVMLRYLPANINILNVTWHSTDPMTIMNKIKEQWKALDPNHPLKGSFYKDEINRAFRPYLDSIKMISFITILGMIITCLGLLGMTMYTIQTKAREISIRKIIGAQGYNIISLLSKNYLKLCWIAITFATPLAILISVQILNQYGNRITMSALLFVPGVLIVLFITTITVCSQTIKAAMMNPLKNLRSE